MGFGAVEVVRDETGEGYRVHMMRLSLDLDSRDQRLVAPRNCRQS